MKNIFKISYTAGIMISAVSFLPKYSAAQLYQQTQTGADTIKVAANVGYDKASKFKRVMLGQHYRQ